VAIGMCTVSFYQNLFFYFFGFGGLLPLFPPEGFPVLLGHCGFGFGARFELLILFKLFFFTYSVCFSVTAFFS
jgi:hypothetical protein